MSDDKRESGLDEYGFNKNFESVDVEGLEKIADSDSGVHAHADTNTHGSLLGEYDGRHEQAQESFDDTGSTDKPKKSNSGLVMGVSAVIITVAVGIGGYFLAPTLLGGGGASLDDRGVAGFNIDENDSVNAAGVEGSAEGFVFSDAGLDDSDAVFGVDVSSSVVGNTADLSGNELVISYAEEDDNEILGDDIYGSISVNDSKINVAESSDAGSALQVTEEEQMYDSILVGAATIDAPHDAIKIDKSVVGMELQLKRLSRIEHDVKRDNESLKGLSAAIEAVRVQTLEVSKAVELDNKNSADFSKELTLMRVFFEKQMSAQNESISQLKTQLAGVDKLARAPVSNIGKSAVVAAKPAPVSQPVAVVAQKAVSLPKPLPRPVAVQAPNDSSACAVTKVSENWRVKGVTPSSAYVERVQDGYGLLLRKDVSLPGFGTVRSFNPVERSVCTTSGIVRR